MGQRRPIPLITKEDRVRRYYESKNPQRKEYSVARKELNIKKRFRTKEEDGLKPDISYVCRRVDPKGMCYYCEIEANKTLPLFGCIGVTSEAGIILLMHGKSYKLFRTKGVFWRSGGSDFYKYNYSYNNLKRTLDGSSGGLGIGGDSVFKFKAGDCFGIYVSSNKQNVFLVNNGIIIQSIFGINLPEVVFYVRFIGPITINDGSRPFKYNKLTFIKPHDSYNQISEHLLNTPMMITRFLTIKKESYFDIIIRTMH